MERARRSDMMARRGRDHIADRPGTKIGSGPKKLIFKFDFQKGFCIER